MLIQVHMIQNHAPANLNRDDLGAPKTCYFGNVLRLRISSQCLKRSIRMSSEFRKLLGGIRTRRLAQLIAEDDEGLQKKAEDVLKKCGIMPKNESEGSKMLVYTTRDTIKEMSRLLREHEGKAEDDLAERFRRLIAENTAVPDMAMAGRMLEPTGDAWKEIDTTVEAALQAAHAISTHEARLEVDYYVAVDDIPGADAGAGYVDEAMFASACFYKYFSIDWGQLIENLDGFPGDKKALAAHTVGAFIRAAALVTPTGKQNSFAAHNPPDGILIEIRNHPISYANAFAKPVEAEQGRDMVSQSIAQLARYACDMDAGYGEPEKRFWFSPNFRHPLRVVLKDGDRNGTVEKELSENNFKSLEELVRTVIKAVDPGLEWEEVQKVVINSEESVQ